MKKLLFTFALALIGFLSFGQTASQLIPTQGLNPKPNTPPNFLYVNQADNRIWPVLADSIRLKYINVQWLNDSVIVIADRRYVKLAGSYSNPTFVNSLSASKVTGLSTVAITNDYNDLANKPVLSSYMLTSTANATFYPNTNPSGFISSVPAQSFASLIGKPTTLSGYGITDAVPNTRTITINGTAQDLSANRSYTIDKASVGLGNVDNTSDTNKPLSSAATTALNGKQATLVSGTNIKTVGGTTLLGSGDIALPAYNAGTGISIASNVITNTAPDQVISIASGTGISVTGTYPAFTATNTAPYVVPSVNSVTRTLNSNFTISTTKQSWVAYTISLSVTNPLLVGTSVAAAYLEYSTNAGSTWIPVSDALVSSGVGVAVAVAITNTQSQILNGTIPANALVRIRTTTSGTASNVFVRGQETY